MYASKNFCQIDAFVSNTPGEISTVGELSPYAATFSRELGYYQNTDFPGYDLVNFISTQDTTKVSMDPLVVEQVLNLVHLSVQETTGRVGEIFPDELLTVLHVWAATHNVTQIELGEMLEHANGVWMPNWIKFSSTLVADDNEIIVWLGLQSLINEYTDFEIVVIPPIDPIDNFWLAGTQVQNLVQAVTVTEKIDRIQAAREGHPETIVRSDSYEYIDPMNSAHRVPTDWSILIYGPAGNNIDAIKTAMIDFILANSTHTRAEWMGIFPGIFRRTEFILAPHWHQYAIPNQSLTQGIYSANTNLTKTSEFIHQICEDYNTGFIDTHATIISAPYRSLLIGVCGSPENRDVLFELSDVYPDYINVPTTSTDFNRMNINTQQWALMINDMLIQAEKMTEISTVPAGMSRVKRGDLVFTAKSMNNIQYLIVTKASAYQLLGL